MVSTKTVPIICFTLYVITNWVVTANPLKDAEGTGSSTTTDASTTVSDPCDISQDSQGSELIVCTVHNTFSRSRWYEYSLPMRCLNCSLTNLTEETFVYYLSYKFTSLNLSESDVWHVDNFAFDKLTSCEVVDLSRNFIESISALAFSRISQNLKELYLQRNRLSDLYLSAIAPLIKLEKLNMAHNQLTSLLIDSHLFQDMTKLRVLDLSHNSIEALDCFTFANLISLQELNLEGNVLSTLEPLGLFTVMPALMQLNLANNALTTLPLGSFSGLGKLQELNLSNNKLKKFDGTELIPSFTIDDVDISGNNISFLDGSLIYAGAPTLKYIHLGGNFFYCDDLVRTLEFFKAKGVEFPVENGEYALSNIGGIGCTDERIIPSDGTNFNYKRSVICSLYALVSVTLLFFR